MWQEALRSLCGDEFRVSHGGDCSPLGLALEHCASPFEELWKWGREQGKKERLGMWSGNKGFQGSFCEGSHFAVGIFLLTVFKIFGAEEGKIWRH